MKIATKINGVIIEMDDGDWNTSDITLLDGELADEADEERIRFRRKQNDI